VAADATIDWFCPGGIADEPALWHLLDPEGGAVRVGPVWEGSGAARLLPPGRQRYREGSNVVETVLQGPGGTSVRIVDLLPWEGPGLAGTGKVATGRIVRLVTALAGPLDVEIEILPSVRPGRSHRVHTSGGVLAMPGLEIRGPLDFDPAPLARDSNRWRAVTRLGAGEEIVVTVGPPGPPIGPAAARSIVERTDSAWRSWLSALVYDGPYRATVERCLVALRGLTGPEGAPFAAGTTSLARRPGSERTSDDRFVSIRDTARAVRVMAAAGMAEDAQAAEEWLRRCVEEIPRPWPSWVGPDVQPPPGIEELRMAGWRRSQPVVTGRDHPGPDIGLLGEVLAAVGASARGPGARSEDPGPLSAAWSALASESDWTCDHWREADTGRWGARRRVYVSGRLEVWHALDRMARLARRSNPLDLAAVTWQAEARGVLSWLETNGSASDGGLRMDGSPGAADDADAALLCVAWRGPWPTEEPLVTATVDRVLDRLGAGNLVYRYSDGVDGMGPDNPDLACSLDAVLALARLRRWEEAHERMGAVSHILGHGVPAQTADPLSGEVGGNLPSAATALSLVEAALALSAGPR
jgi:hypothetical protein